MVQFMRTNPVNTFVRQFTFLTWLSILTALAPFGQARAGDTLTVTDAVRMAVAASPAVQQQLASVQASQARVQQTRSNLYPVIEGDADYARLRPVPEIGFPGFGVFSLVPEDNWDFHVSAFHTLYDFGKRDTQVKLGESRVQTSTHAVETVRSGISYQTVRVFNSILFLRREIAVQDQEIAALNEHLDVTQKRVATGVATDFDVLTTQVRVAAAQNQRADMANGLSKQETILRQLLNLPADHPVMIKGEFPADTTAINRDSLEARAVAQRPELQLANDAEHSAKVARELAGLGDRPSLRLSVIYGFKNGYPPNLNTLKSNIVAGAGVTVPIWDGQRVRYQKDEAEANVSAEQAHIHDLELQVKSETDRAISDVNTAMEKVRISQVQVEQAQAAVVLARARYVAGTATNLDLLDAETALASANLGREQALYALAQSRYSLQQAVGEKIW
jgi:outer membrane protein